MSAISIAFKITALVLLLGILGIAIGVLIVDLNIRDDVEATVPPPPPTEDTNKNVPAGKVISSGDKRFSKFQSISDLYEKWMNVTIDPCDDFYHYVCGKGQKNKEQSPFTISQITDNQVESKMWKAGDGYFENAPLSVKQAKWIHDKCSTDSSYTVADQQAKIKDMLNQFIGYTDLNVPFLNPNTPTVKDKTKISRLMGYAKGQYGALNFLTAFVSVDFKNPDTDPYRYYIDQPVPMFIPGAYSDANYPRVKPILVADIVDVFNQTAQLVNNKVPSATKLTTMAQDVVELDKVISTTMQQDATIRRQVERNYNQFTLADLNNQANNQFDWIAFIQSAMTRLGDDPNAQADGTWTVIVMEKDITFGLLNDLIAKTKAETIVNYIYYKTINKINGYVPPPPAVPKPAVRATETYRAVFNPDRKTLTGMLRKPDAPETRTTAAACAGQVENLLPWAATRMYVDTDIPDKAARDTLKQNVAEIANWIFFGFRSQLDQLNWMDAKSKQGAFDKLNNIQLNVAFPDWVTDDKKLTDYYAGLDITKEDNFMNQWIKLTDYRHYKEVEPIINEPPRDRGDFSSFIGITNAWYQPQMNSITFPEGILQEPFYSPDYPIATIFGGLGSISGHELTHGFDDQGVQWDGIGALKEWMTDDSQTQFNSMAQCVIDEYGSFCPYPGVCLNGENTQGENIADNGGIQAAYKALKAYESLNGPDPRLPGFASNFNSDQLFFLTFAQTWCDQDMNEAEYKVEIAADVHSPAFYRVLGTIQNFPAFRNAFNCPAGTLYTPEKHCDVWTSKPFK